MITQPRTVQSTTNHPPSRARWKGSLTPTTARKSAALTTACRAAAKAIANAATTPLKVRPAVVNPPSSAANTPTTMPGQRRLPPKRTPASATPAARLTTGVVSGPKRANVEPNQLANEARAATATTRSTPALVVEASGGSPAVNRRVSVVTGPIKNCDGPEPSQVRTGAGRVLLNHSSGMPTLPEDSVQDTDTQDAGQLAT